MAKNQAAALGAAQNGRKMLFLQYLRIRQHEKWVADLGRSLWRGALKTADEWDAAVAGVLTREMK